VLFLDLDGTLLAVEKRHYAAYRGVLELPEVRGIPIPEREYWGLKREGKPWDVVLKRSRLLPTKYALFRERFEARLEAPELLSLDELKTGTPTFLGKVYTKTPIVLVTQRGDGEALENQLVDLKIRKYFVEVLSGRPKPQRRPQPDLRARHKAALVRARYRLLPTEALWVGDTETDVKAARSLGFEVWLVEGGHRTKALQMKADPDRIEANLPASLKHMLPGGRWQR
jgi:beta-phosphoglucomutase-like phosphatase (HAD superfamily)